MSTQICSRCMGTHYEPSASTTTVGEFCRDCGGLGWVFIR